MSKVKVIEPMVKNILENFEETRNDDFLLIYHVYSRYCPGIDTALFNEVMLGHKELALPSIESITRARRKIQASNEELRASEAVQKIRKEEEMEYINYSRN